MLHLVLQCNHPPPSSVTSVGLGHSREVVGSHSRVAYCVQQIGICYAMERRERERCERCLSQCLRAATGHVSLSFHRFPCHNFRHSFIHRNASSLRLCLINGVGVVRTCAFVLYKVKLTRIFSSRMQYSQRCIKVAGGGGGGTARKCTGFTAAPSPSFPGAPVHCT